nr:LCP family protein [Clostridiales bacterium]
MDDNKTDGLEPVDASGRDNGGDKTQRIDSCDKNLLLSEFGEFGAKATKRKGRFARFLRNRFVPFWTGHNKRNIKIAAVVLSAAAVFVLSFYGVRIIKLLGTVDYDDGIDFSNKDATYVEDETDFSAMHEVSDAGSLDELLREWATNGGEKMYSKNVINVMLFGVDSEDGTMSGARSDAMMLASVNLKTKKITLVSFFRDSYTYMNIDGSIRYNKINAANNWGGPATVVETLENNYKIEIDKFVSVDFKTFPD